MLSAVPAFMAIQVSKTGASSIGSTRMPGKASYAMVNWSITAMPRPARTSEHTVEPNRAGS